jgi:hypothetical protein
MLLGGTTRLGATTGGVALVPRMDYLTSAVNMERLGERVRGAVEYDRGVGGTGHRPELALDLVLQQVLSLIELQQQVGGRAHDVAAWRSGEKASASPAKLDRILRGARLAAIERVVQGAQ